MLMIGIDEAGYGPVLGPLCHGFAAVRVPDALGDVGCDLWRALSPAVSRANGTGIAIDDSKKIFGGKDGLYSLESGVRAFMDCVPTSYRGTALDLHSLIPSDDLDDLKRDSWFEFSVPENGLASSEHSALKESLAKFNGEIFDVGARALSARAFNSEIARGANKAEVNWRVISRELKRLAELSGPNESVFAAIDRQGGRKFYASLLSETFGNALVSVECECGEASVYRIEFDSRCVRVGFYVGGDSKHLLIALASMAAKLAREKYMLRFNAFFQRMQPGLKSTAGYYTDAMRFLKETKELRRALKMADGDLIRVK